MATESVLSAMQDKNSRVGFVVGEAADGVKLPFFECGRIVDATDSGKTLITESGVVFKRKWREDRFVVQGNPHTTMVVIKGAAKKR